MYQYILEFFGVCRCCPKEAVVRQVDDWSFAIDTDGEAKEKSSLLFVGSAYCRLVFLAFMMPKERANPVKSRQKVIK
jgi:hypothetical protein